jgi:quercetin dioxygenase-like cupin family protein
MRKLTWVTLLGATIIVTTPYARPVQATPATGGFVGTTLAVGRFDEINAFNQLVPPGVLQSQHDAEVWLSWQKTKGPSDVYFQSNVFPPGASSGWHTHPGHSLLIVTAGTVTAYEGNDGECTPHVYTQGMGFLDPGGEHVHNIRNEGTVEARTMVVQLIPAGAMRRIDAEDPGNCAF